MAVVGVVNRRGWNREWEGDSYALNKDCRAGWGEIGVRMRRGQWLAL